MRVVFFVGACISVAGIVLRLFARTWASTQMSTDVWNIDEAAGDNSFIHWTVGQSETIARPSVVRPRELPATSVVPRPTITSQSLDDSASDLAMEQFEFDPLDDALLEELAVLV